MTACTPPPSPPRRSWPRWNKFLAPVTVLGALIVSALPALGTSTPAAAACSASIAVPNLTVSSTNTYSLKGTLTNRCGAADASWDMDYGTQNFAGWIFTSNSADTNYYYPSTEPLGRYHAAPTGAWDSNFNSVPQNAPQFYIKLATRITISAYRSGSYVYVRAHVTRFMIHTNYGLGAWVNSANRTVKFQYYRSGWQGAGTRVTGTSGWTPWQKVYSPVHRSFRAQVLQIATMWGAMSASVKP